ncbi:MAG: 50S ribosome-binding GTPase, partial [Firmicutes bacterium]|nr:50S ribosome-binding GTPase [Bacillota bacterium]
MMNPAENKVDERPRVALAGNPNVGKSTIFNALTGARQHTGNWTGKTVENAEKRSRARGLDALFIDLPGTYTLTGGSAEENIARDYITERRADIVVLVADAGLLERNLILLLQITALSKRAVLCLNFADEAKRRGVKIDCDKLSALLGIPVVQTCAHSKKSLNALAEILKASLRGEQINIVPQAKDITECVLDASKIAKEVTICVRPDAQARDRRIDKILVSKVFGIPVMLAFLGLLLWLTVAGANYPSAVLAKGFDALEKVLYEWLFPRPMLADILIGGIFHTVAAVVSVMLPPMSIFFPLFAVLEEFGYLPRVAFLLDKSFERSGTCGKQALCMCMGIGC